MGGKWTADTPGTENALFVDGRLHYLGDELKWHYDRDDEDARWQVSGPRLEATLVPFHLRRADTNALIIASRTRQAFGHWSGWAIDDDGNRHDIDGLLGWAEEAYNRWENRSHTMARPQAPFRTSHRRSLCIPKNSSSPWPSPWQPLGPLSSG